MEPKTRFEGIVTDKAIEMTNEQMEEANQEKVMEMLTALEPKLFSDMLHGVEKAKSFFQANGVKGKVLRELSDALASFYVRGFMLHRTSINLYDAGKIEEMYNHPSDKP